MIFALSAFLPSVQTTAQEAEVFADRTIVPEGAAARVLIKAVSFGGADTITIVLEPSGPGSMRAELSSTLVRLIRGAAEEQPIDVSVQEVSGAQTGGEAFRIVLTSSPTGSAEISPSSLSFTIPPNDIAAVPDSALTGSVAQVEGIDKLLIQGAIDLVPDLEDTKSFSVSFDNEHMVVQEGIVAARGDSFPISIVPDLTRDAMLKQGDLLRFTISHLDAFTRMGAKISAGSHHSCGIRDNDTVACWGYGLQGQTDPTGARPRGIVERETKFLDISAGHTHSCGVKMDRTIACWGSNSNGRADLTSSERNVRANAKFLAVSAGGAHTCGIKLDRTTACWGALADPAGSGNVQANTQFLAVSAGWEHACGIKANGAVACWGVGLQGRTDPTSASPRDSVTRDTKFLAVSAGGQHSCGIKANGAMACWGLGDDDRTDPTSASPQGSVTQDTRFLAVSAGRLNTCGIKMDRTLACWGSNQYGQTDPTRASPPDSVTQDTKFLAVSAGGAHVCAVKMDGAAVCWGSDRFPNNPSAQPDGRIEPKSAGFRRARVTSDTFWLFEKSSRTESTLQLGDEVLGRQSVEVSADRTVVPEGTTVFITVQAALIFAPIELRLDLDNEDRAVLSSTSVRLTDNRLVMLSLSVKDDQTPQAAGVPLKVALSSEPSVVFNPAALNLTIPPNDLTAVPGGLTASIAPVEGVDKLLLQGTIDLVPGLEDAKSFSVSFDNERMIVREGIVAASQNSFPVSIALDLTRDAMLEHGDPLSFTISHLDAFTRMGAEISAGSRHTCAIRADGAMACWGGNAQKQSSPTESISEQGGPVGEDDEFLAVSAGNLHTCAIRADSTMACWGSRGLLRSDPASASPPGSATRDTKFLAVSAGSAHSCGIKADSTMACWGFSNNGRTDPKTSGQNVRANTQFLAVGAGSDHTCAVKADGTMACWGSSGHPASPDSRNDPSKALPRDSVTQDTKFLAVSAGNAHSCGIKADSTMACWGFDRNNRIDPKTSGQNVDENTKFLAVSAGGLHTCAIKMDRTLACWGLGDNGRTDPTSASPPGSVTRDTQFLAVGAGAHHSCGIRMDGAAVCWGSSKDPSPRDAEPDSRIEPRSAGFRQARAIPDTFWLVEKSSRTESALQLEDEVLGRQSVEVSADRTVVPEGTTAFITVQAASIFAPIELHLGKV